jgi:glycosyltransferase involved in cell wall biosynthesis
MLKVSVVIPTFNRGYIIKEALRNIDLQTWKDFEVIVIDDGSTDNTEEILRKVPSSNSRVRYVRHETNRGVSAARNTGILSSNGEYIAFLDSDDRWVSTKLEEQMRVFHHSPNHIGLVHTAYRVHQPNGRMYPRFPRFEGNVFRQLLGRSSILCSSVIVPRSVFDEVGLFDERMMIAQDYDMWLRITREYLVRFVPLLLVDYYTTYDDRLSLNRRREAIDRLQIYRKFRKEIEWFNVRHRHLYFIAKCLILGGKRRLGQRILVNVVYSNPKDMRYILFLAYSFITNWDRRIHYKIFTSLTSLSRQIEARSELKTKPRKDFILRARIESYTSRATK